MMQFIANKNLLVHSSCASLIEQVQSYAWDQKAADKGEDRPIKKDDHAVDSCRYLLASTFKHGLNNSVANNLSYDQIRAQVNGFDMYDQFNHEIAGGIYL